MQFSACKNKLLNKLKLKKMFDKKEQIKETIDISEDFLDSELSENQEKLENLSAKQKKIITDISGWLVKNRNYKDYDIDYEFKVDKIIPLLKFVEHGEIIFDENGITQNLRVPLNLTRLVRGKEETVKQITQLQYKSRYRASELNNYTKGINIAKEMNLYMDAQVAMLVGSSRGVIGKLFDSDHSLTRLIQSLYFL